MDFRDLLRKKFVFSISNFQVFVALDSKCPSDNATELGLEPY
jgi:hypothetical protein